jgi:hypothetical protein
MQRAESGEILFDFRDKADRQEAFAMLMEHPAAAEYLEHYSPIEAKDEHAHLIAEALDTMWPDDNCLTTVAKMAIALKALMRSEAIKMSSDDDGEILPEPAAPAPDPTPRDRNGKPLTQVQLEWSEMNRFANESSMDAVNQRKHVDPKFKAFIATRLRQEMSSEPVETAANLNANRTPQTRGTSVDVQAFATRYRTMSVADVKKELSAGMNPLGPAAAAESNRLFEAACAAGLI